MRILFLALTMLIPTSGSAQLIEDTRRGATWQSQPADHASRSAVDSMPMRLRLPRRCEPIIEFLGGTVLGTGIGLAGGMGIAAIWAMMGTHPADSPAPTFIQASSIAGVGLGLGLAIHCKVRQTPAPTNN